MQTTHFGRDGSFRKLPAMAFPHIGKQTPALRPDGERGDLEVMEDGENECTMAALSRVVMLSNRQHEVVAAKCLGRIDRG